MPLESQDVNERVVAALRSSGVCAVFVGAAGAGDWETGVLGLALRRATRNRPQRLIPVLLPGAPEPFVATSLPPALTIQSWVDLRIGVDHPEAVRQLAAAIRGAEFSADGTASSIADAADCPYLGLEAFQERHAELFFGRDADVQRLLEQLKANRFLAVVAPSGTGKSSLVRAGLVPRLRQGGLTSSETWIQCMLTPGSEPLRSSAETLSAVSDVSALQQTLDRLALDARTLHLSVSRALVGQPAAARVVVVVDQFEEAFTQCWDQREQAQFAANLLSAATVPEGRTVVVLTMRADFYARCAMYPELAACVAAHQHLLSPMDRNGLRQTIEGPARKHGLTLEPGLVDTVLHDVGSEAGALPLLEYGLMELWRQRRGGVLTLEGYHVTGGASGALAQRAEDVFSKLSPTEQTLAQRLLLRLIEPGEGTEDSRRRAPLAELVTHGSTREETTASEW
jgi:hypothetical protein